LRGLPGAGLPDSQVIKAAWAGLAEIIAALNAPPAAGQATNWTARLYPSPSGQGRNFSLVEAGEQGAQFSFDLDESGTVRGGWWASGPSVKTALHLMFEVTRLAGGYQFEILDTAQVYRVPLGREMPGLPRAQAPLPENPTPIEIESLPPDATVLLGGPQAVPPIVLVVGDGEKRVPVVGRLTIGRSKDNDLCLDDTAASRNHAVLEPAAGGWQICELNSTNGTWLNDSRITGSVALKVGDALTIGKTRMRLEGKV
jgi:hypothetical protein